MKRLAVTLLFFAALSAAAFAETPTERHMNSFDEVSSVKTDQAPQKAEGGGVPKGYNKAIAEHLRHEQEHSAHHGRHHAKHPHAKPHQDKKP